MRWAIYTIMLAAASLEVAYSQEPLEKEAATPCGYSELYRKEGWVIPGINGAKKKHEHMAVPGKPGTYATELQPTTRASTIQVFRCSREHAGRLEVEDVNMGIGSLYSFDVGGRIFAYSLVYGVDGIGAEWSVMFYDLDGSGRFTSRRAERSSLVPELIPDWVKKSRGN